VHFVYLIRSVARPDKTYVGQTECVDARLAAHNAGHCLYTARYRPWELVLFIGTPFPDKAMKLERYLKSGSGHSFAHRHLW
jgi:putative endonuclease